MRRWFVPTLLVILLSVAQAGAQDARILMIGNSYTDGNQLDQLVAGVLADTVPAWNDVYGMRVTQGGMTLAEHAVQAVRIYETLLRHGARVPLFAGAPRWLPAALPEADRSRRRHRRPRSRR